MNDFKKLRELSGMNKTKFAEFFGIPYRSVQNWEMEISRCPEYLLNLIEYKLNKEGIIDMNAENNYRMNEGRNARYKFIFTRIDTGEVLLEGYATGGNKSDCRKYAHTQALKHGLEPLTDDNIKFWIGKE